MQIHLYVNAYAYINASMHKRTHIPFPQYINVYAIEENLKRLSSTLFFFITPEMLNLRESF